MENHTREQLLKLLENNSRLTNAELAIMLDVTQEQIHDEIASLEKKHIICGYHTLINWDKVNDNDVTALVELHVTPQGGNGYLLLLGLHPLGHFMFSRAHFLLIFFCYRRDRGSCASARTHRVCGLPYSLLHKPG